MAEDDGFLSRWSRRKAQVREGLRPSEPAPTVPPLAEPAPAPVPAAAAAAPPAEAPAPAPPPPPLTMDDVARLGADSDYSAFAARHVDPQVRNAAMKKLFFSDPHFNVMDGLDTYIDDYHKEDPLPRSVMRQLRQARSLGLIDDELEEQDLPHAPELATPAAAAPIDSPAPAEAGENDNPAPDEDADLQLQRHDAAGRPGPGPGAAPGIDADGDAGRA
ncbi:MAG: DUF3306 domain-containing protein [Rubrivivax sp.]